jgi:hypothetical protein
MEQDLFEFLSENKKLLQEYVEIRINVFKLELIRTTSRISGLIIWLIISIFLLFLIFIFGGITIGFWLSELMHSNVAGFGTTTGIIILMVLILTAFRKQLFINPIIRILVKQYSHEDED